MIVEKDPDAYVGSRILLSVIHSPIPSCADLSDLAWLYEIGYRRMLLCDELCLDGDLLARAVNVYDSFMEDYVPKYEAPKIAVPPTPVIYRPAPTNPLAGLVGRVLGK